MPAVRPLGALEGSTESKMLCPAAAWRSCRSRAAFGRSWGEGGILLLITSCQLRYAVSCCDIAQVQTVPCAGPTNGLRCHGRTQQTETVR